MARSFNGTNQYLSLATTPVTAIPLTLSCWFYPAATNATYDAIFVRNAGGDNYFGIYLNASGSSAVVGGVIGFGGSEAIASSSTTYSANTWNHAAAVFTSNTSRAAFLNGGGKGTNGTNGTPVAPSLIHVGGFFVSPTVFGPMSGRLAEIGIWNAALTDDEVLSLSKGASPLRVRPGNLVAYWPLYGNGSPEPNYSRNSTDRGLTLNNASAQIDHPPVMALFAGASGWRGIKTAAAVPSNQTLTPTLYADPDTFFTHVGGFPISALTPTLYTDTDTFFTPFVALVDLTVPALPILEAAVVDEPFGDTGFIDFVGIFQPGLIDLQPTLYADAETYFTHVVQAAGIANLAPTLYTDAETFFAHTVSAGVVNLAPTLYADAEAYFTHVALSVYALQPTLYSDADAFFTPIVLGGAAGIQPSLFVDADTFFTPAVTTGVVNVAPTLYTDAGAFFTPVLLSINPVSPTLFVDGDAFLAPVVLASNALLPSTLVDPDIFNSPVIGNLNDLHLYADHYDDADVFFVPHIRGGVIGNIPRREWYDEASNRSAANVATPRPPGTPSEPRS